MNRAIMKCGHAVNAKTADGKSYCIVCNSTEIGEQPDLSNREAKCICCDRIEPSDPNNPCFRYCKDQALDECYCGCRGSN